MLRWILNVTWTQQTEAIIAVIGERQIAARLLTKAMFCTIWRGAMEDWEMQVTDSNRWEKIKVYIKSSR